MPDGRTRTVYDELLVGTVDLHCHVDLEFSQHAFRKALPEWEWLPRAEAVGMRGVVLKSHLWPSVTAAPFLAQLYVGEVEVHTSITLNSTVGGLDPWPVEAAAQMGASAVFFPTWGSRNDRERGGFHRRLAEHFATFDAQRLSTLTIADGSGGMIDAAHEILRLAAEYDLMLSTGHLSTQEALLLAGEAKKVGFDRLVFGHPLSGSIGASHEAVEEAAKLGAFIEVCWPTISPGRHDPAEVVALMKRVGAEHFVLTSDFFAGNQPAPSDLMRLLLGVLHDSGLSQEEIRLAAASNPAALLGMTAMAT